MKNSLKNIFYILSILSISTCKTPYTPAPIATVSNYLVVEGFINITDSTYITLSRTVGISAKTTAKPELKATVSIESNTGSTYPLKELGNGVYAAAPLNLAASGQYHIRIKTANGSQYISDFANPMVAPPIDSLTWAAKNTTLQIAINAHDPKNATHYYRWDYTEAWEFHPSFQSNFISDGLNIINRSAAQQIWDCFTGDNSVTINLGTSIQLSQDVISQQVINTIPSDAEKISVKYTIGVKQYALTKDAYDYWTLLKKNTEQLGGIFDSQPSTSIGNIHSVDNPNEPVIGYISVGTFTTSRIFIEKSQLPRWIPTPFYPACEQDTIYAFVPPVEHPQDEFINFKNPAFEGTGSMVIPIMPYSDKVKGSAYLAAPPNCVDCTLRGSKIPPAYWK